MSKIDCNITENYLKEKARMTKRPDTALPCTISCLTCPLSTNHNGEGISCFQFEGKHSAEAIAIVQKWSNENPVKTILDDFKEKYPNAKLDKDGLPVGCIRWLGHHVYDCPNDCEKCWNRPLSEVQK